tara:strand:- start:3568 stop:4464 length:897 start_codon:yes stop_codon:yes gene_type:complete
MKNFCGLVSIVGRPNVGKSTLLNKILEQKISITSRKSQTTRNNILGIKTKDNYQMVFIDTPGVHINASKVMNKVLNQSALGAIEDADLIIFMLQRNKINALDELILERLKEVKTKKVCVINKLDQVSSINSLLPVIEKLRTDNDFAEIIPVSAKTGQNINDLENIICENLPENNHLYDTNTKYLAKDSFMVSEIIREKIIRYLGEELPHETYVHLQKLEDKENIINIYAEIIVAKESQKGIVVGKNGAKLKKIGQKARIDLEKFFDKKVFLKTWVKTKKNWSNDSDFISSLGIGSLYD